MRVEKLGSVGPEEELLIAGKVLFPVLDADFIGIHPVVLLLYVY